jgi:hypothetical protein
MAVLPDANRIEIWTKWMQDLSSRLADTGTLSKADMRAAVNATDDWIETNQASYNTALPAAFAAAATAKQKAELFMLVALKKFGIIP